MKKKIALLCICLCFIKIHGSASSNNQKLTPSEKFWQEQAEKYKKASSPLFGGTTALPDTPEGTVSTKGEILILDGHLKRFASPDIAQKMGYVAYNHLTKKVQKKPLNLKEQCVATIIDKKVKVPSYYPNPLFQDAGQDLRELSPPEVLDPLKLLQMTAKPVQD